MAITTDALIDFFGQQDPLDTTTSTVADGAFSAGTGDILAWTNDDDAALVVFVLVAQYASGTLNTRPYFVMHARLIDVEGTNDTAIPDANHSPHPLCRFHLNPDLATATNDVMVAEAYLPNVKTSQVYNFYLENQTGVTISASWAIDATPKTVGPHA